VHSLRIHAWISDGKVRPLPDPAHPLHPHFARFDLDGLGH
jgi:hypothetical protein